MVVKGSVTLDINTYNDMLLVCNLYKDFFNLFIKGSRLYAEINPECFNRLVEFELSKRPELKRAIRVVTIGKIKILVGREIIYEDA